MKTIKFLVMVVFAGWLEPGLFGQIANQSYLIDLPAALRLAEARDPEIQLARQRLVEARARHDTALDEFIPWVSPAAKFFKQPEHIQAADGTLFQVRQEYDASATFAAQMTFGDAIYKSLAARQLVTAASGSLAVQRQEAVLRVAEDYFDLAGAGAVVKVTQEAATFSDDYQKHIHESVENGGADPDDEPAAQEQTEQGRAALRQALARQSQASGQLSRILLLPPGVELVAREADLVPVLMDTNTPLDSFVRQALQHRPEIKQDHALYSAANANQRGAKYGPIIPTLGAQLFGGGLGGLVQSQANTSVRFGQFQELMVGVSWTIGPGGLFDQRRIKATEAATAELAKRSQELRAQITREVIENRARTLASLGQMTAASQTLASAAKSAPPALEHTTFQPGIVRRELEARQKLFRAKCDYARAVAEYNKARFALGMAVGESR